MSHLLPLITAAERKFLPMQMCYFVMSHQIASALYLGTKRGGGWDRMWLQMEPKGFLKYRLKIDNRGSDAFSSRNPWKGKWRLWRQSRAGGGQRELWGRQGAGREGLLSSSVCHTGLRCPGAMWAHTPFLCCPREGSCASLQPVPAPSPRMCPRAAITRLSELKRLWETGTDKIGVAVQISVGDFEQSLTPL